MRAGWISLQGQMGVAVSRRALVGFASADLLHRYSFPDILNEDAGTGYQRRLNPQHSLDFRRYAQTEGATTIPLAFNVRAEASAHWLLVEEGAQARLEIDPWAPRVLAQVDCQHRLGHLQDLALELPFICFVGLSAREEMEVFRIINGKAKGLSTSLLDYHDAQLAEDLSHERPELFIALQLNVGADSPWRRQLDLGGDRTSGLTRRASLRTMQKAIREHFLTPSGILEHETAESAAAVAVAFWQAVTDVLPAVWNDPRRHFLTKGVGVYALTGLMADIYLERGSAARCTRLAFRSDLAGFAQAVDWSGSGMFKGLGGESGAKEALSRLRAARRGSNVVGFVRGG